MPTIEVTKDEHLIINKSSKLKANHFAPRNCTTTKAIKQYRKRIIINQSHKSEHRNVIECKKNVPVTKSLNNDRQTWWRWLWREIESSLNQHSFANLLNQLLRFDGILIFITAISQQGKIPLFFIPFADLIFAFRNFINSQQFNLDENRNFLPRIVCLSHISILLRQHYELHFADEAEFN